MEPLCANSECDRRVAPDTDHVVVEAQRRRMDDRNDLTTYYFHPECWEDVADEWVLPA